MNFKQLREKNGKFKVETGTAENTVSLEWDKVAFADGYRVFSSPHGKNYFTGFRNTTDTKVVVKNCKNGVAVDYKVKAYRIADGPDNFFGESVVVSVCPMQTPKKLTASVDKNGNAVLCWHGTSDCDGYKIYSDMSGNGKYTFLCYSAKQTCVIRNISRKGKISFKVRAFRIVNHAEKISNSSNAADIILPEKKPTLLTPSARPVHQTAAAAERKRFEISRDRLVNNNNECLIMFGGDISACGDSQPETGYSFDYLFSSVGELMRSSDFSIAALDTDLNDEKPYTCENPDVLNCPEAMAASICNSGIDAVALNTHLLRKTPDVLRSYPIPVVSQNGGEVKRDKYSIVNINNISVAFISTVIGSDISASVAAAKNSGAEYIAAYCSWKEKHIPYVKSTWRKYAARLASYGVDFIVGCGLNTLCEFDIITAPDGRKVPVAYSLGCLTPNASVTLYEQMGALLCLRLKRDASSGRVYRDFVGYIPFAVRQHTNLRRAVVLTGQNRIYFGGEYDSERARIAEILGEKITPARNTQDEKTISFALHGSALISGLFAKNMNVVTDRSHLFISQLAMCGDFKTVDERYYRDGVAPLYWNLSKGFSDYLGNNPSDYLILDLYYAACSPVFVHDGELYSGGKAFVESSFYTENKESMVCADISKDKCWKKYLERYINEIKAAYDGRHIILVRVSEPGLYFVNGRFIKDSDSKLDMKLLRDMENYFIRCVNPVVIDLSKYYCGTVNKRGNCYAVNRDRRLSDNISDAAIMTAANKNVPYNYTRAYNSRLWLEAVAEYFDPIKKCGCNDFYFSSSNAVDYIIGRTGRDFICANFNDLCNLKDSGITSFSELSKHYDFGGNAVLKQVCRGIQYIKNGNFSDESVDTVVRLNLYAVNDLADVLSKYFDSNGIIPDCRLTCDNIAFYLKCARLCDGGANKAAAARLVSEYYGKNHSVSIDIWGGANLDFIIGYSKNTLPGKSFSDCTPLTAFEPAVDVDLSYCENGTPLFKELSRKFAYKTVKKSDWVIVDFNEIIRPLYKHGSTMLTAVSGCEHTNLFKSFCKNDKKIIPYQKKGGITSASLKKAVGAFAGYLLDCYGDRIILSRFSLNSNYIDINGRIRPFNDDSMELKNKFIAAAEKEFIKQTNCYVLDYCDKFIGEQAGVRGQAFTAAYEEMFYTASASAVDEIVKGREDRLCDRIDLSDYISRAEKITAENPDMSYELKKQVIGEAAMLV